MSRGRGRRPERAAVTIVALLAAAHCWPRCFYAGTVACFVGEVFACKMVELRSGGVFLRAFAQ